MAKFKHYRTAMRFSFRKSNLSANIQWLRYLIGNDFDEVLLKMIAKKDHLSRGKAVAQEVVEEQIYAHNTTGGTGRIKRSVKMVHKGREIVLYFDPKISPAKGSKDEPADPSWSYAAFFEKEEFDTFIKRSLPPNHIIRHRPFMVPMSLAVQETETKETLRALLSAARYKMPKSIR